MSCTIDIAIQRNFKWCYRADFNSLYYLSHAGSTTSFIQPPSLQFESEQTNGINAEKGNDYSAKCINNNVQDKFDKIVATANEHRSELNHNSTEDGLDPPISDSAKSSEASQGGTKACIKFNGFKLGKEAFKKTPAIKQAKLKEIDLVDVGKQCHESLTNENATKQMEPSLNDHLRTGASMPSNKLEQINDTHPSNKKSMDDGKGPIGFDEAFEQMRQGEMGHEERGFVSQMQPPFIGSNNVRMQGSFNNGNVTEAESKATVPDYQNHQSDVPKNSIGNDVNDEAKSLSESKDAKEQNDKNLQNVSKFKSVPSLLDICVQPPSPTKHEEPPGPKIRAFEPPSLKTSVTFTPRGSSRLGFGDAGGVLNKPYGFGRGAPNMFTRPAMPAMPVWPTNTFVRPGFQGPVNFSDYSMQANFGNQLGPAEFNLPTATMYNNNNSSNPQQRGLPYPVIYENGPSARWEPSMTGVADPNCNINETAMNCHKTQSKNTSIPMSEMPSAENPAESRVKRPNCDSNNTEPLNKVIEGTQPSGTSDPDNSSKSENTLKQSQQPNIEESKINSSKPDDASVPQDVQQKEDNTANAPPDVFERVRQVVTPLWNMPISVQLDKKNGACKEFLGHLKNGLVNTNPALNTWFQHQEFKNKSGMYVDNKDILASPVTDGYRNKCDFVIGINPETNLTAVGFLIEQGTSFVGPVGHLNHISKGMKYVASELGTDYHYYTTVFIVLISY